MINAYPYVDKFNSDILNLIAGILNVLVNTVYFLIQPLIWFCLMIFATMEWLLNCGLFMLDWLLMVSHQCIQAFQEALEISYLPFLRSVWKLVIEFDYEPIFLLGLYVLMVFILMLQMVSFYRITKLTFPDLEDYELDLVICIIGTVFLIIFFFLTVEWFSLAI